MGVRLGKGAGDNNSFSGKDPAAAAAVEGSSSRVEVEEEEEGSNFLGGLGSKMFDIRKVIGGLMMGWSNGRLHCVSGRAFCI